MLGWLTEKLTGSKKEKVKKTPAKAQPGWGKLKSTIMERKRQQEQLLKESGLRNTHKKARG